MGKERNFPSKANPGVMGERGTVLRQFLPLLCPGPSTSSLPPSFFLVTSCLLTSKPAYSGSCRGPGWTERATSCL